MTISERLREFAVNTSCHGIPHIATAKTWPLRLFWTTIVVVAATLVIVDVKQLCERYQEYPKIVQSEIKYDELPFPAVTICNLNPVRRSQVHLVPQLEQLLTACDLPAERSHKKTTDYCQAADSYNLPLPNRHRAASTNMNPEESQN